MEKRSIKSVLRLLLGIVLLLTVIQCARIAFSEALYYLVGKSFLSSDIAGLAFMSLFSVVFAAINRNRLSFFPKWKSSRQKLRYAIASALLLVLAVFSFLFSGISPDNLMIVLISALITPLFEEMLFRGYIWNRLARCLKSEWTVYLAVTLLFALWHLGYADTVQLRMSLRGDGGSLLYIMLMKTVTGLFFGIVLGFVRYKSKNCLASAIAHGLMNLFGK